MSEIKLTILNPEFSKLCYVVGIANINDKHDRSAPSNYHWKVLKCRMILFTENSVLTCPDQCDIKQIYIVFKKSHVKIIDELFKKFSLMQSTDIKPVTAEVYQMCFEYTLTARLAPTWNQIGKKYYISNRNFLITNGMQSAVEYTILATKHSTKMFLKAIKINLTQSHKPEIGEWVRVLPSLLKAVVEEHYDTLPTSGGFKCYKDLRRHWKNIHGYRLPETEPKYYAVKFWHGEPLTYPETCIINQWPIIVPVPKSQQTPIIKNFISTIKSKMPTILGETISARLEDSMSDFSATSNIYCPPPDYHHTQPISLCTPSQVSEMK